MVTNDISKYWCCVIKCVNNNNNKSKDKIHNNIKQFK